MSYNRYYTQPVWTDKLSEIYARQSKQLEEDLKNKLEHSQNLRDTDPGVTNLELTKAVVQTAEKLAPLAGKFAKSLSDKAKASKQSKLKKKWLSGSPEWRKAHQLKWQYEREGVKVDAAEIKNTIQKDLKAAGFDKEYIDETLLQYDSLTGDAHLEMMEFGARDQTLMMTDQWVIDDMTKNADKDQVNLYYSQNAVERTRTIDRWRKNKLLELGYSEGILEQLDQELERKNETGLTSRKNAARVKATVGRDNRFIEQFTTASNTEGFNIAQWSHNWIKDHTRYYTDNSKTGGLTAKQQATNTFVNKLRTLGETKRLTRDNFERLLSGIVEDPVTNKNGEVIGMKSPPMGKTLRKVYFNSEQERFILDGITKGENLSFTQLEALVEDDYSGFFEAAVAGRLKKGTNEFNNAIARLKSLPLKNADTKIAALERVVNNDQSKEAGQIHLDKFATARENGTLYEPKTLEAIKLIPHEGIRRQLLKEAKLQQFAANQIKLSDTLGAIKRDVLGERKAILGPLGRVQLTGPANAVNIDIQNFYRKTFFKKLSEGRTDYATMAVEARIDTENYKKDNGWGIKLGDKGSGKFSVATENGEYSNFWDSQNITVDQAYKNQEAKWNLTNGAAWEKSHTAKVRRYGNETDPASKLPKRYGMVGGIFSNEQIAHFANTGQISSEMRFIAAREGVNISRLLGYAINAIVDSEVPAVQRFSENFNLEQISTAQNSDEIILKKSYNKIELLKTAEKEARARGESVLDLETLASRAKRFGFDSLSGNQVQRLLVHLGEESTLSEGAAAQVKDFRKKETLQFYKDNDAKGAVENFNTLYPLNNITINDIKWNPATKKWDLNLQGRELIPTIRQR